MPTPQKHEKPSKKKKKFGSYRRLMRRIRRSSKTATDERRALAERLLSAKCNTQQVDKI